ncbi:hypothetical protein FQZ97_985710 [compost metagenome]
MACGHGHHWAEVARSLAVGEVAPAVAELGIDQRIVDVDRRFEHVVAAVDLAGFLAFGQQGAIAGGGEETADAAAGGAQALSEVALGNNFQLDLAGAVQLLEHVGADHARVGAQNPPYAAGLEQGGEAGFALARVVAHQGKIARALGDQRVDQVLGHPGAAEAAHRDSRAVGNLGQRLGGTGAKLVDHDCGSYVVFIAGGRGLLGLHRTCKSACQCGFGVTISDCGRAA